MKISNVSILASTITFVMGAALAGQSFAQDASETSDSGLLEEVLVTATKRSENIQDIPISITALSSAEIEQISAGVPDIRFMNGRVANLTIESSFGRVFPRFYIRGYGNTDFDLNASQPVSYVVDEIVQENPMLKGFPVFDVERIEVLRGPQGSLFGRNTPAGIVKVDSVKPTDSTDGYFRASYGSYNQARVEGAFGTGFDNGWSARLSILYMHQDDYVNNGFTGEKDAYEGFDEWAGRFQLAYDNGGKFRALFNLHGRNLDGSAILFRANIIQPGAPRLNPDFYDRKTVFFDGQNTQELDQFGGFARLEWDLGDLMLTSITGYESLDAFSRGDIDGGFGGCFVVDECGPGFIPFDAETADGMPDHSQWTQEIRLTSNYDGPFNWIGGFFYFNEDFAIDTINYSTLFGGGENGLVFQDQKTKAYAFFGSASWDLSDRWQLGAGIRYSHDEKDYSAERTLSPLSFLGVGPIGPIFADPDDSRVTWDLSASFAQNDQVNWYARVATGFRAPSIQGRLLFGDTVSVADSETSTSYEGGIKASLADGRARVNFNLFTYTVDDAQLTAVGGQANFNQVINANKVKGSGFELDLQARPTPDLLITYSLGYTDTKIKDDGLAVAGCGAPCTVTNPPGPVEGSFLVNGNPLPQAPKITSSLIIDWVRNIDSGQIYVKGDWMYRSKINFVLYEALEYRGQSLSEVGLRVGYRFGDGHHDLSVYGRNIADRTENIYTIDFNNLTGIVNDPRTWGIEYAWRY
ncbi:MAG: TonB-dependent receptor [Xanthomonadales bacterium]|nr:TonB-dependent receptor [Gammaproteobacteria bacterium]MBT8053912.1 TonB-dependent receptor [Gammaproteobacteria bacterium]NND58253.1 TonB-dependent receptor [Xanthomonadales bacterium]NNK52036.1 TonB-dependent receptor [Xanthomonadales bacterium]